MAKQSRPQKKTIERVMHEFKHGELERRGGRKVKSPKQAIAIALSEAGASRRQSPAEKRHRLQSTKTREARGETAKPRKEGRGGAARRAGGRAAEKTKAQLYEEAKRRDIPGRSKMSKGELAKAVGAR
ncbi:MAG: hypothetical protein KJZ80_18315 [Hyphomicrobiaceae bacterium]|nr:hypothetical protein [Hyphomicrobiaceae bacterium]